MRMSFTVLSKSAKNGNKCVAGICDNGTLVRIVSDDESNDGAIPNWYIKNSTKGLDIRVLDRIEVEVKAHLPNDIQPENYLVDLDVMPTVLNRVPLARIIAQMKLREDYDTFVFMNQNRYLNETEAIQVGYSLKFIIAKNVCIRKIIFNDIPKTRVDFVYNGIEYRNISLTDYDFFEGECYEFARAGLFISLAHRPFTKSGENRYYKIIAKVFPLD